jgi:nucleotide-binding universal stress UspA family protein
MSAILAAIDFSPSSRTALLLAATLAGRRGTRLVLVHAVEPAPVDVPPFPVMTGGAENHLLQAAELLLGREAGDLRQRGIEVETRVLLGSAAQATLEVARELRADLIVMGTHGRRGAAHLFLGSVAERVVREATCPVLVAREGTPEVRRWEGAEPLRLTVGVDRSAASEAALSWLTTFSPPQPSELSLVRVYSPGAEAVRYGLDEQASTATAGPPDRELLHLLERDLRRDAVAFLGRTPARLRYRAVERDGAAAEALAEDALLTEADALVVGVEKHPSGRAALASGAVLRSSILPVFCIPEAAAPARRRLPQVRSVLLATDLSDASREVVLRAYGLLSAAGGRVELCTVHEIGPVDAVVEVPLEHALSVGERAGVEARLRALIPGDAEVFGITTHVSVLEARFAADAIVTAAERMDVDLVAVGMHHRSGIERALLGSVAEEIVRRSPRPVLVANWSRTGPHL